MNPRLTVCLEIERLRLWHVRRDPPFMMQLEIERLLDCLRELDRHARKVNESRSTDRHPAPHTREQGDLLIVFEQCWLFLKMPAVARQ